MTTTTMTAVNTHLLGINLLNYCKSLLLDNIKVEPIPPVFFEIYNECYKLKAKHFRSYHSSVIRIVDTDHFVIEYDEENAKNK